jgi:glycosyltransferase involved in cell wall biosynthesis
MNILILTQYFPPETGAPQNRLHSLATHLSEFGAEITILTAMPSYPQSVVYEGYKGKWFKKEQLGKLTIYRSWIFVSQKATIINRLLNYFSFVFTSLIVGLFRIKRHDIIICESPPLFLGITALLLKWIKSSKLVFNVSDLWPESAEKLEIITNKPLLNIAYKLEGIIYKNAHLVSGQTQGILDSIQQRYPGTALQLLRNGIDVTQFNKEGNREQFRQKHNIPADTFVIAYAGIIGHAQGLDIIIDAAARLQHIPNLKFVMVGNGPVKNQLIKSVMDQSLENVQFIDSVPRTEMPDVIAACDAYITPLRKNDLFLGVIPSKIFEPLFYGKPVLIGVDGEARNLFVDEGKCALYFEPENIADLVEKIQLFLNDAQLRETLGNNGKIFVRQKFDRQKLASQYWERLQKL